MTLDRIFDRLRQWGRPWAAGTEPVEIHRALLEDVEAQAVAVGGGRRVFPFDRVEVKLLAITPEERSRLEAIAQSGWDLEREIKARLKAGGVRFPEDLAVTVAVTLERGAEFGNRRYALACRRGGAAEPTPAAPSSAASPPTAALPASVPLPATAPLPETAALMGSGPFPGTAAVPVAAPAAADATASPTAPSPSDLGAGRPAEGQTGRPARPGRPVLHLAVLKGKAVRDAYDFTADRIYLGRLEEVLDAAGRVRRRNDLAFLEEGELNQTVSREHARIAWDAESRAFWLRDEGSASGTMLFRAGRAIEVSRHDRRGVRLENGDEIYLGRTAVKVRL